MAGVRQKFTSAILPPYVRRSPRVESVLPLLYLHGLSSTCCSTGKSTNTAVRRQELGDLRRVDGELARLSVHDAAAVPPVLAGAAEARQNVRYGVLIVVVVDRMIRLAVEDTTVGCGTAAG